MINVPCSEWSNKPTKIDTMYLIGEGYLIPLNPEVESLTPYQKDQWASSWLKKHSFPVHSNTQAYIRHNLGRNELVVTSTEYKLAAYT